MNTIESLKGLIDQIKETQEQQKILAALDAGNKAMKELHKIVSVEDAERCVYRSKFNRKQIFIVYCPVHAKHRSEFHTRNIFSRFELLFRRLNLLHSEGKKRQKSDYPNFWGAAKCHHVYGNKYFYLAQ